jgi:methionyl-tRNA formyltransferase
LTNNPNVVHPLLDWLRGVEGADNVAVYSERIAPSHFYEGGQFSGIEFVISYNYAHIVKQAVICLFPHRIINLHTSLLPWNKGASPNIWSFLEGTPSGVTIHEIDAGVDTGDILLRREIVFDYKKETLKSSYDQSHEIMRQLFCDNWDKLKSGLIKPKPQSGTGTVHYKKDSLIFDHIISYDDTIEAFVRKCRKYI